MKRYFRFAPIAIFVILLTVLLLPTSEAKRTDNGVRHSLPTGPESFPDLFNLNKQEQGAARRNQAQTMTVGWSIKNDESPALRDMKVQPVKAQEENEEANENPELPYRHIDRPDPVIQSSFGSLRDLLAPNVMPGTILNFDGILFPGVACNCAPPDTDGEVGLTQYVQMVNNGFQVFDKTTGASTFGPAAVSTLWSGFGGV